MNAECSTAVLESALTGNLTAENETSLHRHLETCETCSAELERLAGGTSWCREAASLLITDEFEAAVPTREEWSDIDFTVEHLDPADEPNVLGRLGGYDVLEIIGHGGMGVVLKGFDRQLKRCVAIKVLSPQLAHSALAKKRFAREAQAAAAVVHPNVLAIHQVQPNARLPYQVMPLVAGESLAQRLASRGTLELKEILRIGMQVAAGLAAAHEQGLVHRDVKPANILLEKGVERAVLTDFGLARAADDVTLTRWGIVAGTPQYMSPEQARGEPLDGRSDLFSLGCVLYEMATGVSPFRAESMMATMRRLVDDAPQALASLNPELPPWYLAIVNRLLEKDPSKRFQTTAEVSELLEACLAHVQQPARTPLPAGLPKKSSHQGWRPNVTVKGVLGMLTACSIGLFGILLLSATPPEIGGKWAGEGWGNVVLDQVDEGQYAGSYSDTFSKTPGKIQLKWSRIERRFNGTWKEGEDRFGKISLRLVDVELRGAWTTSKESRMESGRPRLADLVWRRGESKTSVEPQPKLAQQNPGSAERVSPAADSSSALPAGRGHFAAKLVLVFYQDKSRRAVPSLVVNVGDQTYALTTAPATVVPEGTVPAIDRAFLEVAGRSTPAKYDPRSIAELSVYRVEKKLEIDGVIETASPTVGDALSPLDVFDAPTEDATVVGLDRQSYLELPERDHLVHRFENLIEVDQALPEGTPLFKDGKLAGLTLLGSRFKGDRENTSLVVPARRIVEFLAKLEQRGDDSPPKAAGNTTHAGEGAVNSGDWSEPLFGLRMRLSNPQGKQYRRGQPLPLLVEMQNVGDAPMRFADLHPYCRIQVETADGQWLGIAGRDLAITPWERADGSLKPHEVMGWNLWFDRLMLNKPVAAGSTIQIRVSVPRQIEEPDKLPRTSYSQPVTLRLVDAPPFGANVADLKAADVSDRWAESMNLIYRETGGLKGKSRAIQIDGQGSVTLLDCGEAGRAETILKRDRLDALAARLRQLKVWELSNIDWRKSPPNPDVPEIQISLTYGGSTFVGIYSSMLVSENATLAALQTEMEAAIVDAVKAAANYNKARRNPLRLRSSDPVKDVDGASTSVGPPASLSTRANSPKPMFTHRFLVADRVKSIACSPKGELIAVANGNVTFPLADDWKRTVDILDAETGKSVVSLQLTTPAEDDILAATEGLPHFEVGPVMFSPDGEMLAVGTGLGQVKLFQARTGELIQALNDEPAKLAETKTPESLKSLARAMGGIGSIAFSPDGSLLAVSGSSFEDVARNWGGVSRLGRLSTGPGRLKVWDLQTGELKHDLVGFSHARQVAFSPDGNLLSTGDWSSNDSHGTGVIMWNPQTSDRVSTTTIEANCGTHFLACSPIRKLMAWSSISYDNENDTYATSLSLTYPLSGITDWRQTIPGWANPKAFTQDGKCIVLLCGGESIRFIDTETGVTKHELRAADSTPGGRWTDFAIPPQGDNLIIGGIDGEKHGFVAVWSLSQPQ